MAIITALACGIVIYNILKSNSKIEVIEVNMGIFVIIGILELVTWIIIIGGLTGNIFS